MRFNLQLNLDRPLIHHSGSLFQVFLLKDRLPLADLLSDYLSFLLDSSFMTSYNAGYADLGILPTPTEVPGAPIGTIKQLLSFFRQVTLDGVVPAHEAAETVIRPLFRVTDDDEIRSSVALFISILHLAATAPTEKHRSSGHSAYDKHEKLSKCIILRFAAIKGLSIDWNSNIQTFRTLVSDYFDMDDDLFFKTDDPAQLARVQQADDDDFTDDLDDFSESVVNTPHASTIRNCDPLKPVFDSGTFGSVEDLARQLSTFTRKQCGFTFQFPGSDHSVQMASILIAMGFLYTDSALHGYETRHRLLRTRLEGTFARAA
jgi:hypothetical protein